jgi:hypothetical protein
MAQEDMFEKYNEHVQQLAQIDALLLESPDDATLLELKQDIQKFIVLASNTFEVKSRLATMSTRSRNEIKYHVGDRCMAPW